MGKRVPILNPLVVALILANLVPEIIFMIAEAGLGVGHNLRDTAYEYGAFFPAYTIANPPRFALQPFTQFFTYGFLHTGPLHLVINMSALLWIGHRILGYRPAKDLIWAYLVTLVGAGEWIALIGSPAPVVGASGALYGLFAFYFFDLNAQSRASARPRPLGQNLTILAGLTSLVIAVEWLSYQLSGQQLSWQAHAGGFLTGGILAIIVPPPPVAPQKRRKHCGSIEN